MGEENTLRGKREENSNNKNISKEKAVSNLDLNNIGGIFLLLIMGLVSAAFASLAEWCWNKKHAKD